MSANIQNGTPNIHPTTRNAMLTQALLYKKDEFFTQYDDIAKEMLKHQDQFKGKTVYCNCDDPFESAFFRFFLLHFDKLKLKKLVTTCYDASSASAQELPLQGLNCAYKSVVTQVPTKPLTRRGGSLGNL